MSHHSSPVIKKHIESSQQLVAKMHDLTTELSNDLLSDFQKDMGVPFPSVIQAVARIFQYDLVYSTSPNVDEYLSGAKNVLQAAIGEDYPGVVLNALSLVQNICNKVIGSGTIQTGLQSDSARLESKDGQHSFVTACFSLVNECQAQDWLTTENFYVAYYAFAVWEPSFEELAEIHVNRTVDI